MKSEDELGDWRRSHYSTQVTPEIDSEQVTLFGWVSSVRTQGGITFLIVNDKEGMFQVTTVKGRESDELLEKVAGIGEHTSIGVKGTVKKIAKAPNGAEVIPSQIKVFNHAEKPPFSVFGGELPSIDKRLDIRSVDLRREKAQALFKIQRVLQRSLRSFFDERGYSEVRTPKLISTATEGGASLFSVLYYNRPAFLTQSPQLYKEELTLPFEKVYEIGPAFRAEESRTQKHLSEITSVDIEEAFVDYNDVMDTLEALIKRAAAEVADGCAREFEKLKRAPVAIPKSFERLTYDSVVNEVGARRSGISWGDDITGQDVEELGRTHGSFYFITDWPTAAKPFYIRPKTATPKVSESFDLMHGALELASGGTRVESKAMLVKRLKEQKLKPQAFEYHLGVFDYGMPPHAGFGLGLERLMMVLTGEQNIREVTLFPRDKLRLTP
ncbi:MAG: aspartate--tRNA(Asn) ligase [Nitrososphaerota archaeon]|jgi:aspartyl-tRNA synthetase|nr:aspartate--tRNA(Asn) ligase [Nitrososphaerota archaeon]